MTNLFRYNPIAEDDKGIMSPLQNDSIKNGELFICFKNPVENPMFIELFIDDVIDLTNSLKINGNLVTALYTDRLSPGNHTIYLIVTDQRENEQVFKWDFVILKRKEEREMRFRTDTSLKKNFVFRGSLNIYSRISDITGPGSIYRPEPRLNNLLDLNGTIDYKKVKIPLRISMTNHENGYMQPRNRFMIGFQIPEVKVLVGDINPYYHKLVLYGLNIRGVSTDLSYNRFSLQAVYGMVNKSMEGSSEIYNINMGIPPVNIQPDSSYIISGTYRRMVYAVNYFVTEDNKRAKTYLTFLKSTDILNSIQYGGPAAQNVVFGMGHELKTQSDRINIDICLAISMTTFDIRNGTSSKEELENLFNVKLKIDPLNYQSLIILNTTSTPYSFYKFPFPSVGLNVNAVYKILKQRLTIRYNRIGGSYYSFGNPLLINDRQVVGAEDHVNFWKNKINLSVNYNYLTDNLSRSRNTTRKTHVTGPKLVFSPGNNYPSFIGAYNIFYRKGNTIDTNHTKVQEMLTENYMIGSNYKFKTKDFEHSLNVFYNRNNNRVTLPERPANSNDVINVYVNEIFPVRVNVTLLYDRMFLRNDSSDIDVRNSYGCQVGYHTKKSNFRAWMGFRQTNADPTAFVQESSRTTTDINFQFTVLKNMLLSFQAGYTIYKEKNNVLNRDYEEFFGMVNLKYLFN
ncbi:MAG: hypothetical protein HY958_09810 [Bacteroidia bacterium]|nr:hypothetical protein [Bacteroidia bacterium]